VLAVCQGRTLYPADDVEERRGMRRRRRKRRRRGRGAVAAAAAAVRHAVGTCSALCMSALVQVHDGQQRHRGGKGSVTLRSISHYIPCVSVGAVETVQL